MINFQNGSFVKLRPVYEKDVSGVQHLLIPNEEIRGCYKGIRDYVVFTDKRVIFEFIGSANIVQIGQDISQFILK